jgi:triacylglycerol esterase/lipase EstA (alpha/beta hydrolase family)
MEGLQTQINRLDQQIDTLNQSIAQLTKYVVSLLEERKLKMAVPSPDLVGHSHGNRSYREMMMESKDILLEESAAEMGMPRSEKVMSPELQIQRLTAQLTAAYNRIAALEEQLLAQRVS